MLSYGQQYWTRTSPKVLLTIPARKKVLVLLGWSNLDTQLQPSLRATAVSPVPGDGECHGVLGCILLGAHQSLHSMGMTTAILCLYLSRLSTPKYLEVSLFPALISQPH